MEILIKEKAGCKIPILTKSPAFLLGLPLPVSAELPDLPRKSPNISVIDYEFI